MHFEGYDDELPDEEQVIDEFLGDNPRARELRLMRITLEERQAVMQRDMEWTRDERGRTLLRNKIAELHRQIAAIRQEEAITAFVEGTVRGTLNRSAVADLI